MMSSAGVCSATYVFKKRGLVMLKIATAYFSNNELHCLEVGYGVSALKNMIMI